jgi:hypothetical protein
MTQFSTTNGSRVVITSVYGQGRYESRLYVGNGEIATLTSAKHTTEKGAKQWAKKVLAR